MSGKMDWDILDFASRAAKFVEDNFKIILAAFVVVIVASSLYAYKKSAERKREMTAFTDLYKITQVYDEKREAFMAAQEPPDEGESESGQPRPEPPTGDLAKDYGSLVQDLKAFIEERPGLNATAEAALVLAEIYQEYGEAELGAQVLSDVKKGLEHKDNVLTQVLLMRAGDLWAESNQCERATELWRSLAEGSSFMKETAQLKMGVCLQEIGKLEEAKAWFEKLRANSPESVEGFNAKRYLRFLKFKANHPKDEETKSRAEKKDSGDQKAS